MSVGAFVLIALCAVIWLIFKFGDMPVIVSKLKSFNVFVRFSTAPGVQENTPVKFCGYQIGRVINVKAPAILKDLFTEQFYYQTEVVLSIDKKYDKVPADVEVKLMTRGLGSSFIQFNARPFDAKEPQGPFLVNNDVIQGSTGMTSEFFPEESQEKLDELAGSIGILIDNINAIIGDPNNQRNFSAGLANLSSATEHVSDILGDPNNKHNISEILSNLSAATEQATRTLKELEKFSAAGTAAIKTADSGINKAVTAFVDTSEELGKTAAEMRLILEKVNSGQGSAARFLNDGKFYEGLLENTQQIQLLLEEIKVFVNKANDKGIPLKLK